VGASPEEKADPDRDEGGDQRGCEADAERAVALPRQIDDGSPEPVRIGRRERWVATAERRHRARPR
jgi:hypothetical protein